MIKIIIPPGATPIDPDEMEGLIPSHITLQSELNEWEELNTLKGRQWVFSKKHKKFFTLEFVKQLHIKMFDETWKWAGKFRSSNKNIGVDYPLITTELKKLLADIEYQILNKSFPLDEIAFRFHHRLVAIHPFINGNGRHSRLMTDALLYLLGQEGFTWGKEKLGSTNETRDLYIKSLKEADKHNYYLLENFVRS